jgi:acetyl-CoA C-acetyltransferase
MHENVAIVGVGQTNHTLKKPGVSVGEMVHEAVRAALEDAQLTIKDVDAVIVGNMDFFEGNYLSDLVHTDFTGAYLKSGMKMNTGGSTGGTVASSAWYHVASGMFDVVMTIGYEKMDESHPTSCITTGYDAIYDRCFGTGAIATLAQQASMYMDRTGCTQEHLAMCRVQADKNAMRNPYAHLKLDLTVEKIMSSRYVVYPLRLFDLCPASCGACVVIMAKEKKAKKITKKPVWYRDVVTVHQESSMPPLTVGKTAATPTQTIAAKKLFPRNGITDPFREIQVFEIYSPAMANELMWLEDFGLCAQGEAWKLLEKGVWSLEGELPVNPSGGVVATNPIGATGLLRVAEAALQIRGDAGEHQVPREVKKAIASAWGGSNYSVLSLFTKSLSD